jgi:hypothetical protein
MSLGANEDRQDSLLQNIQIGSLCVAENDAASSQIGEPVHDGGRTRLKSAVRNKSMTFPESSCPAECRERNDHAIGQFLLRPHFANRFRLNNPTAVELNEEVRIFGCGTDHSSTWILIACVERRGILPGPGGSLPIRPNAIGCQGQVVIQGEHGQSRRKDLSKGLSGCPFECGAEQSVAVGRVGRLRSRLKQQGRSDEYRFCRFAEVFKVFGAEHLVKARVFSDSALVGEQPPDGHTLVLRRQFRYKFPNGVIQGDSTLLDQRHG